MAVSVVTKRSVDFRRYIKCILAGLERDFRQSYLEGSGLFVAK